MNVGIYFLFLMKTSHLLFCPSQSKFWTCQPTLVSNLGLRLEIRFENKFLDRHMMMITKRKGVLQWIHFKWDTFRTISFWFSFASFLCVSRFHLTVNYKTVKFISVTGSSQHILYSLSDLSLSLFYLGDFILVTSVEFEY